ncbi:MAG: hypothetical protein OXG09_05465, partial [Chloroflexi bacterium]|nr:hypothetical protein [Chloroflexota bacterium]
LTLQWQASSAKSGPWAAATGTGHSTAAYTVPVGDAGRWLRLRVVYTDGGGTAETVFSDPVPVGTLSLLSVLVEPTAVLGAGSKITDKASLAVSLDAKVLAGETVSVPLVFAGGALGTDFTLAVAGSPSGVTLTGSTVKFTGPATATETATSATVELTATSAAALAKTITVKPGVIAATGGSLAGTRLAGSASRGGLLVSPDASGVLSPAPVTVSLARADSGTIVEFFAAGRSPAGSRDAELTVTLDRALRAGEQVQVPLAVTGTAVTAGDIAWALKAGSGVNTGVRLGGSALAPSVTFSAGARIARLVLAASDDFVDEDDETVTVALGDLAGDGLSTSVDDVTASDDGDPNTVDNTVAVTVADDDTARVVLSSGPGRIGENNVPVVYTVRLGSEPAADVTVTISTSDATAAKVNAWRGGWPSSTATLAFTPANWFVPRRMVVTTVNDDAVNSGGKRDAKLTFTAASDDPRYSGATADLSVAVVDDDKPQVTLTAPATVAEGSSVQVTATLSDALVHSVTVPVTAAGTGAAAASAADWTLGVGGIRITAGALTGTITLAAVQDSTDEPPETLTVALGTLPAPVTAGVTNAATVTIADDDPNTVTLTRAGSGPVIENSGTAKLTVTLARALAAGERIDVPLVLSGKGITAADVTAAKTTGATNTGVTVAKASTLAPVVTLAGAGAKTAELTVSFADSADEQDETLTVTLGDLAAKALQSNHGGAEASDDNDPKTDDNTFTVEIIDDDRAELIVSPAAVTVTEDSAADSTGAGEYTVRLGTPPTGTVTVTATAGTNLQVASAGAAAATATLSFTTSNWWKPQTVTVTAAASVDDSTDNPGRARHNSTVTHTASGYGAVTSGQPAAVTIVDDEATAVSITATGRAREGDPTATATLTVTLSRALIAGETAEIPITLDGAATRTPLSGPSRLRALSWTVAGTGATIGTDSRARRPGPYGNNLVVTLTGAGARTATVKLAATARDDRDTADETITITIAAAGLNHPDRATTLAGGLAAHSTQHTATTTITDKSTKLPAVTVSRATRTVTELGGSAATATYTLVLDTDPGDTVTVTVESQDTAAVAVDTNSVMTGDQSTLTFTHGSGGNWGTAQTVTVRALNDADAVGEQDVEITHTATVSGNTANDYHQIDVDSVEVDVTDAGHGVIITGAPVTVKAGETATYSVRLKSRPTGNVVIRPTSGATARATVSGDLTFTSTGDSWKTPQNVTVTGVAAGAVSISHAVHTTADSTNYPTTLTIPDVAVTVGLPTLSVTMAADSDDDVTEGASGASGRKDVTVSLGYALASGKTVTVPLRVRGATVTTDYTFALHPATQNGVTLLTSGSYSAQNPALRFTHHSSNPTTATLRFVPVNNTDRTQPAVLIDFAAAVTATGGVPVASSRPTDDVFFVITDDETGDIEVPRDWPLKPGEVSAAGEFRLLFVTSQTRDARSADIEVYNDFVQRSVAVNGHTAVRPYAGFVKVVASTATVDARDNTATTGTGHPIYWLGGANTKIATNYADFYDGRWVGNTDANQHHHDRHETGATRSNNSNIWTGSRSNGLKHAINPLGVSSGLMESRLGRLHNLAHPNNTPLSGGVASTSSSHPFYAMTPVFTVEDAHGVTVTPTSVDVAANGGTKTYTVRLKSQPAGNVTVAVASDDTTHATVTPAMLTFTPTGATAWNVPQTVTVTSASGASVGDTATITHTIQNSGDTANYPNGVVSGVTVTATVTGIAASLSVTGGGTVTEGGTLTVAVNLSGPAAAALAIPVLMRASDSPTADDDDFTLSGSPAGTVSIAKGQTSGTVTFSAIDDPIDEGASESLVLGFGTLPAGVVAGSPATVSITITDNDDAGVTVTESGTPPGTAVDEDGAPTDTYTVKLNSEPLTSVTIRVSTGTTGQGGTSGTVVKVDGPDSPTAFTATEDLVFTLSTWNSPQTVRVQGVQNGIDDPGDERAIDITHTVHTGDTGGKYTAALSIAAVSVSVTDDDPTAVSLARVDSGDIEEGGTGAAAGAEFTVTLSRRLFAGEKIEVPLVISGTGVAAGDVTVAAKAGGAINHGVAVASGATLTPTVTFTGSDHATNLVKTATLTLTPADDGSDEGAETVTVALGPDGAGTNGFDAGSRATNVHGGADPRTSGSPAVTDRFTVTVIDASDRAPSLTLTPTSLDVEADGGTATYTVKLRSAPTGNVTVAVVSGDTSHATVTPATLTFTPTGATAWNVAQTVTVTSASGAAADDTATITHTIQNSGDTANY